SENWKYIRTPRPELYDLSLDPAELTNLADRQPERLLELERLLARVESGMTSRQADDIRLSAAERRSLASLGYVTPFSRNENDPEKQALPDIKDRLKYHDAVVWANHLLDENRPLEALNELQQVVEAVPDYTLARMFLGEALAKSGKIDEALQIFQDLAEEE